MNELSEKIVRDADILSKKIEEKKQLIALASLLWDKKDRVNIELIWEMKAIINRCIQEGNYRRAWRYIVAGKAIIARIERNENSIIKSTTGLILNDGKKVFAK